MYIYMYMFHSSCNQMISYHNLKNLLYALNNFCIKIRMTDLLSHQQIQKKTQMHFEQSVFLYKNPRQSIWNHPTSKRDAKQRYIERLHDHPKLHRRMHVDCIATVDGDRYGLVKSWRQEIPSCRRGFMVGLQSQDGGKKGEKERERAVRKEREERQERERGDVGTREETNSTRVCMDA